jgi:hypothetical protein
MNRYLSPHVTAAVCALAVGHASGAFAAASAAATAAPAFLSAGAVGEPPLRWQSVGDDVLATQSGKYAGAEMISGFVLNLLSTWQLPNGATALAQGSLTVVQNAASQASAQVQTAARIVAPTQTDSRHAANNGANSNALASATGGQNVSVNGVSQITQVAGDGNVGTNSTQIGYSNNAAQFATVAGGSASPTSSAASADGSIKASIAFSNGGVTVALQTPAGLAQQNIVPGNAQQAGTIAQLLQVAGNNQQVTNQLQLMLQTQQMGGAMLRQVGVLQALHNLH